MVQYTVIDGLVSAIRDSNVQHVVLLSSWGAELGTQVGGIIACHRFEELLDQIPGLNVVYLRPVWFMENFLWNIPLIEAAESGASRWMSSSEVEALESETQQARSEATALREETKRLREEIQKQSAVIAGMSVRSGDAQASLPFAKDAPVSQYVARINELQQELLEERKKNQRRKSTPV